MLPFVADATRRFPDVIAWRALYARALTEHGDDTAAHSLLDDIVDQLPGTPHNWTWVTTLVLTADAAVRSGHRAAADAVEPRLEPFAGRLVVVASGTSCEGAVDRYLGLLAAARDDLATACARLDAASRLEAAVGATALVVATRLDRASVLRRGGTRSMVAEARRIEAEIAIDAEALGLRPTAAFAPR